jgi:hypothetical protein
MSFGTRRSACALVVISLALCAARADDAEGVKKRLDEAKKAYDEEVDKFKKAIADLLDKREDDARKAGNKKLLDQITAERKAFEKQGELPAAYPMALQNQMKDARGNLDKAYAAAMKDYLRLKEDAAAEAVEKEQQKFELDSALALGKRTYLVSLKHFDVRASNGWFTNNGTQPDKKDAKYTVKGEPAAHSIYLHPPSKGTGQVRYPLGGKWTVFRATVGVPKIEDNAQDPQSALTFEVVGDGKSLWKSEPVTKLDTFQTCVVRVERVKTLTLLVHAAADAEWCRAIWFEPILAD